MYGNGAVTFHLNWDKEDCVFCLKKGCALGFSLTEVLVAVVPLLLAVLIAGDSLRFEAQVGGGKLLNPGLSRKLDRREVHVQLHGLEVVDQTRPHSVVMFAAGDPVWTLTPKSHLLFLGKERLPLTLLLLLLLL